MGEESLAAYMAELVGDWRGKLQDVEPVDDTDQFPGEYGSMELRDDLLREMLEVRSRLERIADEGDHRG